MKTDIHPQYFEKAKIACSCGNVISVGATKEAMRVELCSACHPFYTGQQKLVDTAGRVDRFEAKRKKAELLKQAKKEAKLTQRIREEKPAEKRIEAKKADEKTARTQTTKKTAKKTAKKKPAKKSSKK